MLKDHFYRLTNLEINGATANAEITLLEAHPIYKGHFPGNPITPGVCQIQMVKETTEEITGLQLKLSQAKNIKFLNVLMPGQQNLLLNLTLDHQGQTVGVKAQLTAEKKIFLKFSGEFCVL